MLEALSVEAMIDALEADGAHRVLKRLAVVEGSLDDTAEEVPTAVGAALDVETTGLTVGFDRIIELSLRRFRFNEKGRITKLDRTYSWLEDPDGPLEPEIVKLTGLTDADLVGRRIDELLVIKLFRSASVIVSHNAAFDRPFVEERLPAARGLPWACSCREIDWPEYGFDGRSLGWLLAQAGWFHEGHRAEPTSMR